MRYVPSCSWLNAQPVWSPSKCVNATVSIAARSQPLPAPRPPWQLNWRVVAARGLPRHCAPTRTRHFTLPCKPLSLSTRRRWNTASRQAAQQIAYPRPGGYARIWPPSTACSRRACPSNIRLPLQGPRRPPDGIARKTPRTIRRYGRQADLLLDLIHGDRTRRSVCGLQNRLASDSA